MKFIKNLLLASLLVLGLQVALSPHSAAALTRQQKIDCADQWDGKTFAAPTYTGEAKFKKTACYSGKGGNCSITSVKAILGGEQVVNHQVSCADPRTPADTGSTGTSGGGGGDGVVDQKDPALGSSVSCSKKSCPLISKYINPLITLLSTLVGIVAVIAIIVGGIQVTTSAGDPQKSAAGKNHIRNAVIGVVAYVFLYSFLRFIVLGNDL